MNSFGYAPHETPPGDDLVRIVVSDERTKEDLSEISSETMRFVHGSGGRALRIALERAVWEREAMLLPSRPVSDGDLNDMNFTAGLRAGLMGALSYLRQFDNPEESPLLR